MPQSRQLAPKDNQLALPAILAGNATSAVRSRVEQFFSSVASIFESWVGRRQSAHTQRAYREDAMAFVKFMGLTWPDQAMELLRVSVQDVQRFRSHLLARNAAPKTLNRRISSLSSFYKYLAAAAAELRLPITVPNPAHAQFISRESTDPRDETRALSAARARQLVGLPTGNSVLDCRAILRFFLYSGGPSICRGLATSTSWPLRATTSRAQAECVPTSMTTRAAAMDWKNSAKSCCVVRSCPSVSFSPSKPTTPKLLHVSPRSTPTVS